MKLCGICISTCNVEERDEDAGKTQPESAVGGKRESTKSVASGKLPHSGSELRETSISKS